jgi:molybdenum cofactor synthesis domain-containing protein
MATAAILVIGCEILSGRVRDENSPWLAAQLRALGVDLRAIEVLPDEVELLVPRIQQLSAAHDHLFTSGGLGPTHDDRTMEAVGAAFGEPLLLHSELAALLESRLQPETMSEPRRKAMLSMCRLPVSAQIWRHDDLFFPLVSVQNVFILPGVPHLFRRKFLAFRTMFEGVPVATRQVTTRLDEPSFATGLAALQIAWPDVEIGSYPVRTDNGWTTTITLESRRESSLAACHQETVKLLSSLESQESVQSD